MIVPTFECNYRCTYCFERPIQNGLKSIDSKINFTKSNVLMTNYHVQQIYKSIEQIKLDVGDKKDGGQIILFGGEPLDKDNKDVIFEIVNQGVEKKYDFAAITNGHDLEHFLPLMGDGGIKQIQISIDGPKEIHDKRRINRKGGSSFDKIMDNIRKLLKIKNIMIQLRVHVDPSNIEYFEIVLKEFSSEGLVDNDSVIIYANTVYSKDKSGNVHAQIENGDIIQKLHITTDKFTNVFLTAPAVNSRMSVLPSLMQGNPFPLNSTYCAANSGNYIFAPDGHIYACWESVGVPCSKVGSYMTHEGLIFDNKAVDKWFNRSTAKIPECLECPFCLVCGGGCAQYAEYNNGTLYKPYCDDFERTFRIALADNVEEFIRRMDNQQKGINETRGL